MPVRSPSHRPMLPNAISGLPPIGFLYEESADWDPLKKSRRAPGLHPVIGLTGFVREGIERDRRAALLVQPPQAVGAGAVFTVIRVPVLRVVVVSVVDVPFAGFGIRSRRSNSCPSCAPWFCSSLPYGVSGRVSFPCRHPTRGRALRSQETFSCGSAQPTARSSAPRNAWPESRYVQESFAS